MQKKRYRNTGLPVVELMEGREFTDCWLADWKYLMVCGISLHKTWAIRGKGEIVRHLCSDSRCVNPLHLMRGDEFENADDELEVRDFTLKRYMEELNDYSLANESRDRAFYIIVPRFAIKMREDGNDKFSPSEAISYGRELFRADYVFRLEKEVSANPELFESMFMHCEDCLKWLESRKYAVKVYYTRYR